MFFYQTKTHSAWKRLAGEKF